MASPVTFSTSKDVSEVYMRTRKCRFFGMGICNRGSGCTFAHATEELRPRWNLIRTKMCPTLLRKGSCSVDGCKYAHRAEDRRRMTKQHRQGLNEVATGQFNPRRLSLCSLMFDDASPEPLVDKSTLDVRLGTAKVGWNQHDVMTNMPTAILDDVVLAESVKYVEFHHDGAKCS
eukprot:TRINITY_DN18327_c1_g1_i1.p1 TRINITY_DN18327_c1_g1~~TRINITY_DN18327_c1_g1_i1.p1  ORF type:complete len:174 (-),score=26.50 TRINITY_DN18327_c1_g1_i1:273-794(-)